jgi:hypothetical protein
MDCNSDEGVASSSTMSTVDVERIDAMVNFRRNFGTTHPTDTQGRNDTKNLLQMVVLEVETVFTSSSTAVLGWPRQM